LAPSFELFFLEVSRKLDMATQPQPQPLPPASEVAVAVVLF